MAFPSLAAARALIGAIHEELKSTLFPTLRLKYGSPKPGSICTSRSFLKAQESQALDLRYVWDPCHGLLKLVGDFQVSEHFFLTIQAIWDQPEPFIYVPPLQPVKLAPVERLFVQEIGEGLGRLCLPSRLELPSYQHALGLIKLIHKEMAGLDPSMKVKYDREYKTSDNAKTTNSSRGESGLFRYHWRKAGAGPQGVLWFSDNISVWIYLFNCTV